MATARDRFLEAYAELANSTSSLQNYTPAPLPRSSFIAPEMPKLRGGAYVPLTADAFGSGRAAETLENPGDPLWMDALQFVGRPGNTVFGMLDEATDGKKSSFGSFMGRAGKALAGKDETVGARDVFDNLGWTKMKEGSAPDWLVAMNNKNRAFFATATDIALDPLNLLTFGAGSAAKAGVQAGKAASKQVAKDLGSKIGGTADRGAFQVGKNVEETVKNVYDGTLARTGSTKLAERTAELANRRITETMQAARQVSQNRIVNFDVPFTSLVKGFGKKPALISKKFDPIDDAGKIKADDMLTTMGLTDRVKRKTFLQRVVGVDSIDKMDVSSLAHLANGFSKLEAQRMRRLANDAQLKQPALDVKETVIRPAAAPIPEGVDALTRGYDPTVPEAIGVDTTATVGRTAEDVDQFYKGGTVAEQIQKHVADSGGRSDALRYLQNTPLGKAFNRRPNVATAKALDAEAAISGGRRMADYDIRGLEAMTKGMTETEKREIAHVVEGTQRASTPEIQAAANETTRLLQQMRDAEVQAGTLEQTRRGYFPHVLTDDAKGYSPERFEELKANDPEFASLLGKTQANNFSKSRETFQTLAQVDNYMNKLSDRINKATDQNEILDLQEKMSAVSNLFERDPVKALTKRAYKSVSSRVMKKTYDDLAKNGMIYTPKNMIPRAAGADFVALDAKQAGTLGLESGTMVHKDAMQALTRVKELFTDTNLEKVLQTAERLKGIWKSVITTANPSHHIYNLIGNVSNNVMAGVGAGAYSKAGGILQRFKAGKLTAKDREIVSEALEKGVLFSGDSSEYVKKLKDSFKYPVESVPIAGEYMKFMRKFGETTDNFTRLAHYIDKRAAYNSVDQAADSVRTYLFNYKEMTTADRFARLLFPFWNWTRNNIPLQLEKIFQTPRFANAYMNVQQGLQEDARQEGEIPSWMEDKGLYIPGMGAMLDPRLPLNDLSNLDNPFKMAANMLTPEVKVPVEVTGNASMYSGRPIDWERFAGEGTDSQAWVDYALRQTGAIGKTVNLLNPNTDDNFGEKLLQMFIGKPAQVGGEN